MPNISAKLKELRKSNNLTQVETAKRCSMTERGYQRYEADRSPNIDSLIKIADCFNVSIDYLVGRSKTKERQP